MEGEIIYEQFHARLYQTETVRRGSSGPGDCSRKPDPEDNRRHVILIAVKIPEQKMIGDG